MLEKYEMVEVLGEGGEGRVYKVWDETLHRYLAVKETDMGERQMKRLRELNHPLFPAMIDVCRKEDKTYLVMEFIEGMNLQDYMERKGRLSIEQTVRIGSQILDALIFLHGRKPAVIYRDLKPGNVMLKGDGTIKLIDFGTVLLENEDKKNRKRAGTPGYASPEQLLPGACRNMDTRSDIYSFGVMMHYMVTGKNPCEPPYEFRPVREYDRALSKGLERLIVRCLCQNPQKRYQNAHEIKRELEAYGVFDRRERIMFCFQKMVLHLLLGTGLLLFCQTFHDKLSWQQLKRPETEITAVLFLLAWIWEKAVIDKPWKGNSRYRCEKSIWKTDKKQRGLFRAETD